MKPMLASKWDEEKNSQMFPFWAQPKYDGIRLLIGEDGYAYTRSLKPVRNYWLQSQIRHFKDVLAGLDGEVIVGDQTAPDCYRRTSSAVMSYENDDIQNLTLYIFDIWNDPFSSFDDRFDDVIGRMDRLPPWARVAPTVLLTDREMLAEYEQNLLSMGNEGVILRSRTAKYKRGRGSPNKGELIKMKQFVDEEGVIISLHELLHNANPATTNALGYTEHTGHKENLVPMNTLGALELKLSDGRTVRVGTGFTAAMRDSLWLTGDKLIGKTVKFKHFPVGVKDAPRFPVFMGLRDADDMDPPQQKSMF